MDAGRINAHQELIDRLDSDDYEAIISNEGPVQVANVIVSRESVSS